MFKSATIKLTLWYVLIIMVLSLAFSGVLYHFGTHELSEGLSEQYHAIITDDHDSDDLQSVSETDLSYGSRHLALDLAYFNLVVLIAAVVSGYALARRTIKPIETAHLAQIRFTAEASHELRTPLTAMKAGIEATLMRSPSDNQALLRALEDNLKDIDRLDRLTDHLLDIARHQGRSVRPAETVDLEDVVSDVLKMLDQQFREKKLKLKVSIDNARVMGEAQGIRQVLTIVIDNSIKYSGTKGSISIDLSRKGKRAILVVEDKGIGIPSADLPHIFESFYRSKNLARKNHPSTGYGLGLSLAKAILELNHGTITITSKENHGTRVVLNFPLI